MKKKNKKIQIQKIQITTLSRRKLTYIHGGDDNTVIKTGGGSKARVCDL